jgi:hypothetical protein
MQPCRKRHAGVVVLMALSIAFIPHAQGDESSLGPWSRLESVPLKRREELADKLKEFSALPRDRQQAVRDLDQRLATLEPADRDRYLSLLRRYHVWLQDQSEADRPSFVQGTIEERIRKIGQSLAKNRPSVASRGGTALVEPWNLLGRPPFDLAFLIKTWQELADEQKKQVEGTGGAAGIAAKNRKLAELGKQLKVEVVLPDPADLERLQKRASDAILLREFSNGPRLDRIFEKAAEKQAQGGKAVARPLLKNAITHLRDALWLAEKQNSAKPNEAILGHVNEANLLRFEDAIPEWLRSSFDSLSPAESRQRLALVYRLAYPSPSEMPAPKAPAKGPVKLPSAPTTPRSTGSVEF